MRAIFYGGFVRLNLDFIEVQVLLGIFYHLSLDYLSLVHYKELILLAINLYKCLSEIV
jgi:hypothetical protein